MMIDNTFILPADRLRDNDVIVLDGRKAVVTSAYVYAGKQKLKVVFSVDTGVELLDLDFNQMVEVVIT
jgi:hypothetical protein